MIKIEHTSDQELSKDDFIMAGRYAQSVKLWGIKIWSRSSKVNNILNDQNFKKGKGDTVGFGK